MVIEKDFILFRLPDEKNIQLWLLGANESTEFFLFHSFDDKKEKRLFAKEKYVLNSLETEQINFDPDLKSVPADLPVFSKNEYLEKCCFFIEHIKKGEFSKLILSRIKLKDFDTDLKSVFNNLCDKYPSAFVYLTSFDGEFWMGASPERLVSIEGKKLKTVALAGTKSISENREWTNKEKLEHQLVVDYILEELSELNPRAEGTETIQLGEIQHLQTKISAELETKTALIKICNTLHPTPAVCGIPKDKARKFILENEGYDRSYYTGYFGLISAERSEIFVNLRCARLYKNSAAVYVGGGLLAESDPEKEWEETVLKSKALFS